MKKNQVSANHFDHKLQSLGPENVYLTFPSYFSQGELTSRPAKSGSEIPISDVPQMFFI